MRLIFDWSCFSFLRCTQILLHFIDVCVYLCCVQICADKVCTGRTVGAREAVDESTGVRVGQQDVEHVLRGYLPTLPRIHWHATLFRHLPSPRLPRHFHNLHRNYDILQVFGKRHSSKQIICCILSFWIVQKILPVVPRLLCTPTLILSPWENSAMGPITDLLYKQIWLTVKIVS